jgi:transcriptional regulator with XRE-family HTH domain
LSELLEEIRIRRQLPSRAMARAIRLEAGISQAALARALGVHPVTVTRWELGTRRPRGETLAAYVAALNEMRAN